MSLGCKKRANTQLLLMRWVPREGMYGVGGEGSVGMVLSAWRLGRMEDCFRPDSHVSGLRRKM